MERMSQPVKLPLPVTQPVIRENGDAVVELNMDGVIVGEINFSAILGNWFAKMGWSNNKTRLTSVK